MHPDLQRLLKEATRLTRAGNLKAATKTIQLALTGSSAAPEGDVIDVEAHEVQEKARVALPSRTADAQPAQKPTQPQQNPQAQPPQEQAAKPADPVKRAEAPLASTPESFNTGRFGGTGTAGRDYKLFVPPNAGHEPRALVVMLHGCTQNPDDFAAGTHMNDAAREQGAFVLYPEQSQRANPQRCWNWFKHTSHEAGRGEAGILAGMVRDVMATHRIDPSRVFVAGLSAGGAMAANLAAAYPQLFAAVGVHSGLAAGAARDVQSALDAMKNGPRGKAAALNVPTIVFHGDADSTVSPVNGEKVAQSAAGGGTHWAAEATKPARGRSYTRHVLVDPATGAVRAEHWVVHGAGHAWSGGSHNGSYADPRGPDASAEMLRFFMEHPRR